MNSARILVVEDEQLVALDIKRCLESFGYEVLDTVSNGEIAIERAKELRPDLVFMDIMIEGSFDGVTAAARIRDSLGIPIIFLTAYCDDTTLQRARVTEPYGYILKPFETSELRVAVELSLYKHEMNSQRSGRLPAGRIQNGSHKSAAKTPANTVEDIVRVLNSLSIFSCLSPAEKTELAQLCEIRLVKSGQLIADEGDSSPTSFIVVSGRIAMLKASNNGKELIVELLSDGDLLGIVSVVEQLPAAVTVRAQSDATILIVPKASFLMLLEKHPELYRRFVTYISKRLSVSHELLRGLAHDNVETRVSAALYELATRFGHSNISGPNCTVEITRQELADLTGTSVETTIRVTRTLEEAGVLSLSRRKHIQILDMDALKRLAKEAEGAR